MEKVVLWSKKFAIAPHLLCVISQEVLYSKHKKIVSAFLFQFSLVQISTNNMPECVNNEPRGPTPRKRWNLEDKKSLQNLKYQFADGGSPEIQFDLGKQLLEGNSGKCC